MVSIWPALKFRLSYNCSAHDNCIFMKLLKWRTYEETSSIRAVDTFHLYVFPWARLRSLKELQLLLEQPQKDAILKQINCLKVGLTVLLEDLWTSLWGCKSLMCHDILRLFRWKWRLPSAEDKYFKGHQTRISLTGLTKRAPAGTVWAQILWCGCMTWDKSHHAHMLSSLFIVSFLCLCSL